jgi:hypothetical protein
MYFILISIVALSAIMLIADPVTAKPKLLDEAPGAKHHKLGHTTVFEQREEELGKAVAEVIRNLSDNEIDLSGRAAELGDNLNVVVKTMLETQGYSHELNDESGDTMNPGTPYLFFAFFGLPPFCGAKGERGLRLTQLIG